MAKFLTLAQMQTVFADAMRSIREVMVKEIYEPVKAIADQAKAIADGVRRDADAGKFDGAKGERGDTGDAARILSKSVTYQVGDSGSIIPSGSWSISIPVVPQGKYLWTKTEIQFNSGEPVVSYVSARQGMDGSGSGSIVSVNDVRPNEDGNIVLTADDVGALPAAGGDMTGGINMNGQSISGLNDPTEGSQAARKGYVDAAKEEANAYTDEAKAEANAYTDTAKEEANAYTDAAKAEANAYTDAAARRAAPRNLLDNSDFTNLVAQAGIGGNHGTIAYAADRWILDSGTVSYEAGVGMTLNGTIRQKLEFTPAGETSAFVGMASGTASISYADGEVTITSSGGVLKWAAMYSGVYSAAAMPEYQPKGYGAELAECQRYFVKMPLNNTLFYGNSGDANGGAVRSYLPLPVSMRINPSVPSSIVCSFSTQSGTKSNLTYTIEACIKMPNGLAFYGSVSSPISSSPTYVNTVVQLRAADLEISADL